MSEISRYNCNHKNSLAKSDGHLWGEAEIKARLKEAAGVLRGVGLNCRDFPSRQTTNWPEIVRRGFEAYGYDTARRRPAMPSPAAISRADEAVLWLVWLDDAARRITWARASGVPWRRLEDMDGRSHTTLRRIEAGGLEDICRHLNAPLCRDAALNAAFRQGRENRAQADTKLNLTKFIK